MQSKSHELTLRVVVIAVILTLILATANVFLALKLGMLTSASIPAAILSMGILRFFKNSSIWENNLIQTAASAGEAVAGGIVYTIPALVVIGFWHHFSYWENFFLALSSGLLGVLFSVPLRKSLVHHRSLPFPEGRAIAAILQNQSTQNSFKFLVWGIALGALFDFTQTGLHLLSNQWSGWVHLGHSVIMLGIGFSISMMSAGFLIGARMAISIAIGVAVSWYLVLPIFSFKQALDMGPSIWNEQVRYVGIGALLCAGFISLVILIKPLLKKMIQVSSEPKDLDLQKDSEKDIPNRLLVSMIILVSIGVIGLLFYLLPIAQLGIQNWSISSLLGFALLFVLVVGFLLAVVSGYFSAMVGVSASPGSSIVITALLLAAWGVLALCHHQKLIFTHDELLAAEAIVIILASLVTGIAAIANDNIQDLKVGQIIGATPWRQQVMLMLGVFVSALIIPIVMQILYGVYGIGGQGALPAPTAVLLASLTDGFFQHLLPWNNIGIGAGIMLGFVVLMHIIPSLKAFNLSIFGIAIGMYLPLETSTPLFIGGGLAYLVKSQEDRAYFPKGSVELAIYLACGLVAGSAVMDVFLSFIFAFSGNINVLSILPDTLSSGAPIWTLASLIFLILFVRFKKAV